MVDFRYHALSLVAVFLALGLGIVLGVTVGDSLVSDADRNLRDSLRGDVTEARQQARDAQALGSRREQAIEEVVPDVAAGRLRGRRIALVAFGELPAEVEDSVEDAVETGDGRLARSVEIGLPDGRPRAARRRGERLVRRRLRPFDALVVYRHPLPEEETDGRREAREALTDAVLRRARGAPVGVELLATDPSQVAWYEDELAASVDNVDTAAGQLSLVVLLAEAALAEVTGDPPEGSYGYKDSSERALPDL